MDNPLYTVVVVRNGVETAFEPESIELVRKRLKRLSSLSICTWYVDGTRVVVLAA